MGLAALIVGAVFLVDEIFRPPVNLVWVLMVVSIVATIVWFAYFIFSFAAWQEKQLRESSPLDRKRRRKRRSR